MSNKCDHSYDEDRSVCSFQNHVMSNMVTLRQSFVWLKVGLVKISLVGLWLCKIWTKKHPWYRVSRDIMGMGHVQLCRSDARHGSNTKSCVYFFNLYCTLLEQLVVISLLPLFWEENFFFIYVYFPEMCWIILQVNPNIFVQMVPRKAGQRNGWRETLWSKFPRWLSCQRKRSQTRILRPLFLQCDWNNAFQVSYWIKICSNNNNISRLFYHTK